MTVFVYTCATTSKQSLGNRKLPYSNPLNIQMRNAREAVHMIYARLIRAEAVSPAQVCKGMTAADYPPPISMGSGCCCLTARLTACALKANAADTIAWHPYNTVVDTILRTMSQVKRRTVYDTRWCYKGTTGMSVLLTAAQGIHMTAMNTS